MDGFVLRENIKHYLELLERTTDQRERAQIRTLLAEERRKQREREGARRTCASHG
jgi:rubrerythrin